jgi:hypothetical protein
VLRLFTGMQMVRFFYKTDTQQKAKVLRKVCADSKQSRFGCASA